MDLAKVKSAIQNTQPGANIVLEFERDAETYKTCQDVIRKRTRMVGRIGVGYDHKASTVQGRADGSLPPVNAGLKGRTWLEYPYLLLSSTGKTLLRLNTGTNPKVARRVRWFRNGVEVPFASVSADLQANEKRERPEITTFDTNVVNILRIHNEEEWLMNVPADAPAEMAMEMASAEQE